MKIVRFHPSPYLTVYLQNAVKGTGDEGQQARIEAFTAGFTTAGAELRLHEKQKLEFLFQGSV